MKDASGTFKIDLAPNPGTNEALALGCRCPVSDNHYGRGWRGGPGFMYSSDCRVHARKLDQMREDRENGPN